MDAPDPPPPPDPVATAQAQGQMNRETAITQAGLNMVNQRTPQGSLVYNQIGTWSDGTPRYEAVQDLSPEEKALYETGLATRQNVANIGKEQSARIQELLGTPVDLSNEASEARLMELGRSRLDPALASRRASTEQDLINRGIRPGTEAYRRAMEAVTQGENDAYNQLLLTGRGQAVQEALAERNQPINEITALLSGSQVSQPNFVGTPQTGVAGVDYAGLVNQNYQAQLAGWQNQVSQNNAMMGGLFGLGGAAIKAIPWSDRRLKTDIVRLGTGAKGLPVYAFRYIWGGPVQIGYMADEVERVAPHAVHQIGGFKAVDYDAIGG